MGECLSRCLAAIRRSSSQIPKLLPRSRAFTESRMSPSVASQLSTTPSRKSTSISAGTRSTKSSKPIPVIRSTTPDRSKRARGGPRSTLCGWEHMSRSIACSLAKTTTGSSKKRTTTASGDSSSSSTSYLPTPMRRRSIPARWWTPRSSQGRF